MKPTMLPRSCLLSVGLSLLVWGCNRPSAGGPGPASLPSAASRAAPGTNAPSVGRPKPRGAWYLDEAQPKLQTIKLWLGAEELITEMATNQVQVATGMMYRQSMEENEGMLFVFPGPHRAAFYMRNTKAPLSAAYIDGEGIIRELHDLQPLDETSVEASTDQVQYVLETPQGWFQRHNIKAGTLIRTEVGSLRETFFPGRRF